MPISFYSKLHHCEARLQLAVDLKLKQFLSRVFEKQRSIFADWKDDETMFQKQMLESDFKLWGASKVIKMDADVSLTAANCSAEIHQESADQAHEQAN